MYGLPNELSTFSHMTVHHPLEGSSVWLKTTHFHRPLWTVHYRTVHSGQNFYLWFWADRSRILWCLSHWEFEITIRIIVDINGDRIGRFSRWRSYVTYWWCLLFLFDLHNLRKIHLVWIWWGFIRWGWRLKKLEKKPRWYNFQRLRELFEIVQWGASSRMSFCLNSTRSSIETMIIGKTHPTLLTVDW